MKKINKFLNFSIIFVLIFFNINTIFAWENCPIENNSSYLNNYLNNVHKVVQNVNNVVNKNKDKIPKNNWIFWKIQTIRNISWSFNRLFSWRWYETELEYTILEQTKEIPKQLKTDIKILKKEAKSIRLANPNWENIEISLEEICSWIDNCNFSPYKQYTAITVIEELKRSTNNYIYFIQNQINAFKIKDSKNQNILFVNKKDLEKIYSKENIKACSFSEDKNWKKWFFATIIERINNISFINDTYKDWAKSWIEAIDLLYSFNTNQNKIEKQLLAKELQRQWIWWESASAIIWNLEAFNSSWTILWWKAWFFNSMQLQLNDFEEALEKKFPWYKKWNPQNNIIPTASIEKEITKLKNIKKTEINIFSDYEKLKNLALEENTNNDILLNRMIDMHLSISRMINILNKTCPIAVKVCNDQKRWLWDCGQCY